MPDPRQMEMHFIILMRHTHVLNLFKFSSHLQNSRRAIICFLFFRCNMHHNNKAAKSKFHFMQQRRQAVRKICEIMKLDVAESSLPIEALVRPSRRLHSKTTSASFNTYKHSIMGTYHASMIFHAFHSTNCALAAGLQVV